MRPTDVVEGQLEERREGCADAQEVGERVEPVVAESKVCQTREIAVVPVEGFEDDGKRGVDA